MSHRAYGGKNESPGKTRVRAQSYELTGRRLWDESHIVIASEDCGDIKFLLNHGVPANQIVACDINPAARTAAAKYGVVLSPNPRIEHTIAWAYAAGHKIGSINVDLCETMQTCAPIMGEVYTVIRRIGMRCVLMYTFQRGRDATVLNAYPAMEPDDAREAWLRDKASMPQPYGKDEYCSYTDASKGSTMGVYMWLVEGKRGRKCKMTLAEIVAACAAEEAGTSVKRQYKCKKCGEMVDHPIPHYKEKHWTE